MKRSTLSIIAVAAVAFSVGTWLGLRPEAPEATVERAYVLDPPRSLPEFTLRDEQDQAFAREDFQGHWSTIYFGFTYCPDICPSAMAVMAQIKRELDEETQLDDRYYLVSVDPERDDPQRLAEYVQYFDPEFRGLTGEYDQLDIVTRAASALYRVPPEPREDDYQVAHSNSLTLIDPAGNIAALFTSPFDPVAIAGELRRIAAKRKES